MAAPPQRFIVGIEAVELMQIIALGLPADHGYSPTNKEIEVQSPTYQNHWPVLHVLQFAKASVLRFLILDCHADDVQ